MKAVTPHDAVSNLKSILKSFFCRVKGLYKGDIRPKTGAPTIFTTEFEEDIALFASHCKLMRIPRSRPKLKDDILHYLDNTDNTASPFKQKCPGTIIFLHTL